MTERKTRPKIKGGNLLIAEPFLKDPYFENSVVLISEHEEETGTVGFILNNPSPYKIHELIQDFPEYDEIVYYGGPVSLNSLHFLHTVGDLIDDSLEIQKGIYWGGDFDKAKFLIKSKVILPGQIRFYVGYAGWSSGQLREELKEGTWILSNSDINYLFNTSYTELWKLAMSNKSGNHAVIAEIPDHLNLN